MTQSQNLRFDLSDLQPSSFGSTVGQGLWKLFQDFIKNPSDVDGIAAADGGGGGEGLQVAA